MCYKDLWGELKFQFCCIIYCGLYYTHNKSIPWYLNTLICRVNTHLRGFIPVCKMFRESRMKEEE